MTGFSALLKSPQPEVIAERIRNKNDKRVRNINANIAHYARGRDANPILFMWRKVKTFYQSYLSWTLAPSFVRAEPVGGMSARMNAPASIES